MHPLASLRGLLFTPPPPLSPTYSAGMVVHGFAGTAVLVLGLLSKGKRVAVDYTTTASILAAIGFFVGKQALQVSNGSMDGGWSSLGAFNTIVAAYAGSMVYGVCETVLPRGGAPLAGSWTKAGVIKGALTGTVAIAAGAGYIEPQYAVLSTVCSCVLTYLFDFATAAVDVAGFDCFITHGVSGFFGAAMIGLFANNRDGRLFSLVSRPAGHVGGFFGNGMQLAYQCAGISTVRFAIDRLFFSRAPLPRPNPTTPAFARQVIALTVVITAALFGAIHLAFYSFGGAWEKAEESSLSLKSVEGAAAPAATA